jgi:glycosyltransferase involved in cell wall biosynthesis
VSRPPAPRHRIGLDLGVLVAPHPPGVQRVAKELSDRLVARARFEWVPLLPDPSGFGESSRTRSLWWRQWQLPKRAREARLDGLQTFTSAFPLGLTCPCVPVLHELPWRHGVQENAGHRHRAWVRLASAKAAAAMVPSRHVWRDLAVVAPNLADRTRVIPWGVHERYRATDLELELPREPVLWVLGGTRPKKRADAAIAALAQFARSGPPAPPEFRLVITGEAHPHREVLRELAARSGVGDRVEFREHVDEAELPAQLKRATAVFSLGDSEGFGLPVLEALAAGTPAIVPLKSAQSEVAGDRALHALADDPRTLVGALKRALAQGPAERRMNRDFAERSDWDRVAREVEHLWTDLLS